MYKNHVYKCNSNSFCYLICLENIFGNGLIEAAVINLLIEINKNKERVNFSTYLIVVVPIININKKGINFIFKRYKSEITKLKEYLFNYNIRVIFAPSLLLRYGILLSIIELACFSFSSLPFILWNIWINKISLIHCRSYISTFAGIILKKLLPSTKVIFDVRGFFPEEGLLKKKWKINSITYKFWKKIELWLLNNSDLIISISYPFKTYLKSITDNANISSIFFGVKIDQFYLYRKNKNITKKKLGLENKLVFVYNGGLGSWHDPVLLSKVYSIIRENFPHSFLLIFSNFNKYKLNSIFENSMIKSDTYCIMKISPSQMFEFLPACDFGIAPSRDIGKEQEATKIIFKTMIGTKIAEYLASGLPIIINKNIGGIVPIMDKITLGVTFNSNDYLTLSQNIFEIQKNYEEISNNCLKIAKLYFNFSTTTIQYISHYKKLFQK